MASYTKRQIDVEAVQFDGSAVGVTTTTAFIDSLDVDAGILPRPFQQGVNGLEYALEFASGIVAYPSDWVVSSGTAVYPITDIDFQATYEITDPTTTMEATA